MEKGTLIIISTRRGFAAKIEFDKPNGKKGEIPAVGYKPEDDSYNGTECEFRRNGGKLIKLIAHDGKILFEEAQAPATPAKSKGAGGQSSSKRSSAPDSYSPPDALLPEDTQKILATLSSPDNFALKLEKVARYDKKMQKFHFFKRERKGDNYEIHPNYGDLDFQQIADRELAAAKNILPVNNIYSFDLSIDWRLIQGLGTASVYETSITLHHIYGIPYLPASAIKGVVRSWIITQYFGANPRSGEENYPFVNAEFRALTNSKLFCQLFGCPGNIQAVKFKDGAPLLKKSKKGSVTRAYEKESPSPVAFTDADGKGQAHKGNLVFFDAFPLNPPGIEFDIMNPHYGPYYSAPDAKTPPADYYSPVPIPFMTVADTKFRFIVGARDYQLMTQH
ncbi:MAG: type III-B CRISPR module RAMP protein Cmr6 [Bacteroidia bacterium]